MDSRSFLSIQEMLKDYPNTSFDLLYEKQSPAGKHVCYQQKYQGYPIFYATLKINYNPSGKCTSILSNALNTIQPLTYDFSNKYLATKNIPLLQDKKLHWKVTEGFLPISDSTLVPVFQVEVHANGIHETYYVNPSNLNVLHKIDNRVFFKQNTQTDTVGLVFYPDPLTSSGSTYGSCGTSCTDNNDANNPFLEGQRKEVKLKGLTYNNTIHQFELKGPYVEIMDLGSPVDVIAQSSTGRFDYTRDQQGFEQTNAYYFIDRMQRYVQCLGFTNIGNRPVRVDAHYGTSDNSFYIQPSVSGTAGDIHYGVGGVDDAEDMDVIIHEYGHALSNEASPNSNSGSQRMAIDEAIGDYFASSLSRTMYPYSAWYNVFSWDGHNAFWSGRVTNSTKKYPTDITGNIYADAPIFSSALMDIHVQLGASKTDRLVLQMLYGLTSNMSMQDAAMLLVQADCSLFGGVYFDIIKTQLVNRGLISNTVTQPTGCSNIVLNTCSFDEITEVKSTHINPDTFKMYPNPAKQVIYLELPQNHENTSIILYDLIGKKVLEKTITETQNLTQIDINNLPSGMYLIQCISSKYVISNRLIIE